MHRESRVNVLKGLGEIDIAGGVTGERFSADHRS
jgi:hypothetical protein